MWKARKKDIGGMDGTKGKEKRHAEKENWINKGLNVKNEGKGHGMKERWQYFVCVCVPCYLTCCILFHFGRQINDRNAWEGCNKKRRNKRF